MDNCPLGRLKRATKKVMILLNYRAARWKLASIIHRKRGRRSISPRLCFDDRPIGLLTACPDSVDDRLSRHASLDRQRPLQRTMSLPSEEEDVDKLAEQFISNFYRLLRMERQVSLTMTCSSRDSSFRYPSSL
ncbi:hypothetical protein SAY87_018109 [Trapa incisa]|uniref:Uncharacterized protein n=1 Tax=Trapa incisa TaxID=236973 RepID=A0AAN7LBI9_9MYRT|nr:hypothetical protein SAY87_018109 [Trapa incisa]